MTEELRERHKKWIKEFLIPNLIKNQKLIKHKHENIDVKSIDIKAMSLEVAFMLTNCYFVNISIKIKSDQNENHIKNEERTHDIVVKVKKQKLFF